MPGHTGGLPPFTCDRHVRINDEHRLVHKVESESVTIAQCRDHH